jgi:hypothetical protein
MKGAEESWFSSSSVARNKLFINNKEQHYKILHLEPELIS